HKQFTLISKEWYQRTLCSEACASFLMQKILLIEYHRNLSTGFIIEPLKLNLSPEVGDGFFV
ncbi:MAG: hypothetical protein MSL49_08150, partial [Lactobacillus johnsonii]|nr:hypothetical protein [Lactobacillus johnsonii]